MATRNKISRPSTASKKLYTRAGDGPGDSPFGERTDAEHKAVKAELARQKAAFEAEANQRTAEIGKLLIRHGVKSERDTQPVQVRMLKAQIKVLKQIAEQEDRSTSDVIRDLVDAYISHCLDSWKDGPRLDILRSTVRAENYEPTYPAGAAGAVTKAPDAKN